MPTLADLDALAALVESHGRPEQLYVRWSPGPDADLSGDGRFCRGSPDPRGLSANPLTVEPWWGDRPVRLWVARRLYDYRHLRQLRREPVRPWVLDGERHGHGPDGEPLVVRPRPIAWVSENALRECESLVHGCGSAARPSTTAEPRRPEDTTTAPIRRRIRRVDTARPSIAASEAS